ncbi:MAG: tetratricopeptide repeat protein [Proteobacteria bacterium]|nr:tetratricopeptide repeat protein [Pseudomonadota bacterium]
MKRNIIYILLFSLLTSCVTPPSVENSTVIPNKEVQFVTLVKKGQEYANAGRPELAETEIRKALKIDNTVSSVYNDLGYVLLQQQRFDEAEKVYFAALKYNSKNIVAVENLAKVLFKKGDIKTSIKLFEKFFELYNSLSDEQIKILVSEGYSTKDLQSILRSLATAYYESGEYDEAICNSLKSFSLTSDINNVAYHERLLLSLERVKQAKTFLESNIKTNMSNLPAGLQLDYAIVLYLTSDYNLSKDNLLLLQTAKGINTDEKREALLLSLLIAKKQKNNEDFLSIKEAFNSDNYQFCANIKINKEGYWPSDFYQEMLDITNGLCAKI